MIAYGATALHYACDTRSYAIAMLLLGYVDTESGVPAKVLPFP